MKFFTSLLVIFIILISPPIHADSQQLLQLIDYMSADYSGAVENGQIVNEAEYAEMQDFTAGISQQLHDLPENKVKNDLIDQGKTLAQFVQQKESAIKIRQLIAAMRTRIIDAYQIVVTPRTQPDLKQAAALYATNCASCHGISGKGDGPASVGMMPPPIDFQDVNRYKQRTLYGLYNTISHGVDGSGMAAYKQLSDEQRWSLAFYVGSFAKSMLSVDKSIDVQQSPLANMATLTTITPQQAETLYGEKGATVMATLRSHPELLVDNSSKLAFAKKKLAETLTTYQHNNGKQAYQYAVKAYLDGFEIVEQNLDTLDHKLKISIENSMTDLRNKIRSNAPIDAIKSDIEAINYQLDMASDVLNSRNLSAGEAYTSALFILLREGLEALLVVVALIAFLVRTERQDGLRYIHYGWVGALILGALTWWASVSIIAISGASREMIEGIGGVVSAIVLLYVGFWMHDKTNANKWKKFINDNMHKALSSDTLWALSGLSFIAVYREIFETILFYQALWTQTNQTGQGMMLGGVLTAVALLVLLAWLITRYSIRLPLRQFFAVTGGLMFILAIIFAGKGIAALQEAGVIMANPVNFYRIDLLGIYPNLQGLLVQFGLIVLAIILWKRKSS